MLIDPKSALLILTENSTDFAAFQLIYTRQKLKGEDIPNIPNLQSCKAA